MFKKLFVSPRATISFSVQDKSGLRILNWVWRRLLQREYEEFKVRVNALVAKAQKIPDEGWTMQDGTPWPGNNTRDHPGMIQVRE